MIRKATLPYTSVQHTLLTDSWTADVRTLETGIRDFGTPPGHVAGCRVSMFEMAGDPHLHVNVTHAHETRPVKGWAGPGVSAGGFVHNRTFDSVSTDSILHDIRRMVFAPRV
jgi:hypothetical protein